MKAAPGDLDPTFGSGGKVITDFGGLDQAAALALQPDGKIVVAGSSLVGGTSCFSPGTPNFALARYNPDGSLDPTFGAGGKVTTNFGGYYDQATALALQPDGRIVVTGFSLTAPPGSGIFKFALARYNPDGSLDPTFGAGGKVTTDSFVAGITFCDALTPHLDVKIQPDGRIVVAGDSAGGPPLSGTNFGLARYNSDGSLDPTFGAGGRVTTDFGSTIDRAKALALQPDGKIIVAGHAFGSFALARYNPDGSLDPTFGAGGKVITALGFASALALQPDGKLVVAGGSADFALARYNPDGSLDPTFSAGGKVTTDFGGTDEASALVVQPDGKLVVAGFSISGNSSNFALARYNPGGSLDATFGGGGKVITDFGSFDAATAIALQPDGKLVVAGFSISGNSSNFALARYKGDPTLYLRLTPNQTTISPGDPLELDTAEANSGPDTLVDRSLGSLLPPGTVNCPANDPVAFVTESLSLVLTCLSVPPSSFPLFRRNVLIPADLPLTITDNVFSVAWPTGAPGGTYVLFMADILSGSVADGSLDDGDLLAVGAAAVSATQ